MHYKNNLLFAGSLVLYGLLHEVIFGLLSFQFFLGNFFWNMVEGGIALGAIFYLNGIIRNWLDLHVSWSANPLRRFVNQIFFFAALSPALVNALIVLFNYVEYRFFHASLFVSFHGVMINYYIYVLVIALNVLFDFGEYLLQRWNVSKLEEEKFQREKAQFNLELLKNQVNPHFLFNNLNTLSSLIYESPDKSAGFLRKLSTVYRQVLEYKNKEMVTLKEELTFFETYRDLLSVRFEKMLFFEMKIDPDHEERMVIPLTLQMLIENAIKHNIVSSTKPLSIRIYSEGQKIVVENNLQPKESLEFSSGLGLSIIKSRFEQLTDEKVEVQKTDRLFRVIFPTI